MTSIQKHTSYDFSLCSETQHDNPFLVTLSATFEHESGSMIENLPGFYDGDGEWIIRFSPTLEGTWRGQTASDDLALDGLTLDLVRCVANENPNVHGLLRIDPEHIQRFVWEDGEPCIILGFEFDWMFSYHQSDPEQCYKHIDLIAGRGFNAIVTNVYAHTGFSISEKTGRRNVIEGDIIPELVYGPPKMYAFGGTNEEPNHSILNVDFFQDLDRLITYLHSKGILVHLMIQVQNKQVNWPERQSDQDDLYWRYIVARYQAFSNIIWDVGKESFNLLRETGSHAYTLDRISLIKRYDAYDHLTTVHDAEGSSNGRYSEVEMAVDFYSDQIHRKEIDGYNREAVLTLRRLPKPYLNIEYGYELGVDTLQTYKGRTTAPWQDVLKWTYAIYLAGAYACYYYTNTSWALIKFEPEPPGWERYRHLVDILNSLPFNQMEPINELVGKGSYCLANPGKEYLVYLPEGGDGKLDLSDAPYRRASNGRLDTCLADVSAEWMGIYTGERRQVQVEAKGWDTPLENPFGDTAQPYVVIVRVETPDPENREEA